MNGPEVVLAMLLLRVVIPISLIFWIGENQRRRHFGNFHRA